ncbi:MAG: hypothetical protein WAS07_10590 [Micropruina sp.]|nr:hypothetical protein [Micropruina sp.]
MPVTADGPDDDDLDQGQSAPDFQRPPRALWVPADDSSGSSGAISASPIPPPAPVLPDPEPNAPISASGRRFADAPYPEDFVPGIARRSATSASSPNDAFGLDQLTPSLRAWITGVASPSAEADSNADAVDEDEPLVSDAARDGHRLSRLWAEPRSRWTVLASVLVVLGLIAAIVITSLPKQTSTPGSSTSPTANPAVPLLQDTQLLEPDDLAELVDQTTWTIGETASGPTVTTGQPKCIDDTVEGLPTAAAAQLRSLASSTTPSVTLLQSQAAYATVADAETAFTLRLAQLGGCAKNEVYVAAGANVTGLADQSAAVTVVVEQQDPTRHVLLLTRAGTFINVFDVSRTGAALSTKALATAAAESLARQCASAEGTCPETPKVSAAPPPTAGIANWLTPNDLPRVTPGAGRWEGTEPAAPNLVGSQCEAVDLNQVPGATAAEHRIYLLTDDPAAPDGFGVDEARYTLPKASDATKLVAQLKKNFADCAARTKTPTVKVIPAIKVVGADGKNVTYLAYTVSQRISDTRRVTFRVGISSRGNRVTYLLANPSPDFDFTDAQWSAVTARAAQRASQV